MSLITVAATITRATTAITGITTNTATAGITSTDTTGSITGATTRTAITTGIRAMAAMTHTAGVETPMTDTAKIATTQTIGAAAGTTGIATTQAIEMEAPMKGIVITPVPGLASAILDACNRLNLQQGRPCCQSMDAALPSDNNNQALESFFVAHEEKAFYVAYAALWDREAALDAVQDGMMRMVEYYRDKPAKDWPALFRTVLNSKINDIRRRRMIEQGKYKLISLTGLFKQKGDSSQATQEYELPQAERTDGITAPEVEVVAAEIRGKVTDAMLTLPERQRQVFILREWRGLSIKETALTLGCSENSIKQHHFRAMRALRKQLAEVWDYAQSSTS